MTSQLRHARLVRRPQAFTLVELVVALVVLALLVAVSAFAYDTVTEHARKSAARALATEYARNASGVAAQQGTKVSSLGVEERAAIADDATRANVQVAFGAPADSGAIWAGVAWGRYCTPVWFPPGYGTPVLDATVVGDATGCAFDGTTAPPSTAGTGGPGASSWVSFGSDFDNEFGCGLKSTGEAWCRGYNEYGQLGIGATDSDTHPDPVQVAGGHVFTTLSVGQGMTCGVDTDHYAWCWGGNYAGGLGTGTTTDSPVPAQVLGGPVWASVQTMNNRSCGLRLDGSLWCWGHNYYGELGDGSAFAYPNKTLVPTPVAGGHTWSSFDMAAYVTCAIDTTSALWCWGRNDNGQLGDGTQVDRGEPVQVFGGGAWAKVFVSQDVSRVVCGIKVDSTAWCWGYAGWTYYTSHVMFDTTTPAQIPGGGTWSTLSMNTSPTICGVKTDGTAWCWGRSREGQVGDGVTIGDDAGATLPVQVTGAGTWRTISVGYHAVCGIKSDGSARCWGSGWGGQLGDGTTTHTSATPLQVAGGHTFAKILSALDPVYAIGEDGSAWWWGCDETGYAVSNKPAPYVT